jgi:hypothetical protein
MVNRYVGFKILFFFLLRNTDQFTYHLNEDADERFPLKLRLGDADKECMGECPAGRNKGPLI